MGEEVPWFLTFTAMAAHTPTNKFNFKNYYSMCEGTCASPPPPQTHTEARKQLCGMSSLSLSLEETKFRWLGFQGKRLHHLVGSQG